MFILKMVLGAAVVVSILTACGDSITPEETITKITTVDELLARVCELAGDCGSSTQGDIDLCPSNLLQELNADDVAELEDFTTLDKNEQDRILECFGAAVCGRFGGSVLNMSDSDLMDPLRNCNRL